MPDTEKQISLKVQWLLVAAALVVFTAGYLIFTTPQEIPNPAAMDMSSPHGANGGMMGGLPETMPTDYDGLVRMGNDEMDKGNHLLAAEAYRRALALDGSSFDVRTDYGACLSAIGLPQRALEEFRTVIEGHPEHAIAHYNMGVVFSNLGLADSARVHFKEYLRLDPNGPAAESARMLIK